MALPSLSSESPQNVARGIPFLLPNCFANNIVQTIPIFLILRVVSNFTILPFQLIQVFSDLIFIFLIFFHFSFRVFDFLSHLFLVDNWYFCASLSGCSCEMEANACQWHISCWHDFGYCFCLAFWFWFALDFFLVPWLSGLQELLIGTTSQSFSPLLLFILLFSLCVGSSLKIYTFSNCRVGWGSKESYHYLLCSWWCLQNNKFDWKQVGYQNWGWFFRVWLSCHRIRNSLVPF